jgi:uncharacterized protein (TIGR03083 family)
MRPADGDYQHWVKVLRSSHERLDPVVRRLDAESLVRRSYCDEWSIAQVLSHLGSGAEIMMLMIDAALGGPPTPKEAREKTWAQWNSKEPQQQAADYQVADERLLNRLESLGADEVERFQAELGSWKMSATEVVGLRLSEHVLHFWDVQVVLEPDATLPQDASELLVTRLPWMDRIAGKPDRWTGDPVRMNVQLTDGHGPLLLEIAEKVELSEPGSAGRSTGADESGTAGSGQEPAETPAGDRGSLEAELVIPVEAFIRLVYGRLDTEHTPTSVSSSGPMELDELRKVFPGF